MPLGFRLIGATLGRMSALVIALALSAAPSLESRLFIAAGAKTETEAKQLLAALKPPESLLLRKGFPRVVESRSVAGLKPGLWLVVLGACDDGGQWPSHNDGLAALIQRALKGAYAKPVGKQDPAGCPLWLEGGTAGIAPGLVSAPDDLKRLKELAVAMHAAQNLIGSDIVLRRAIALGANDKETLELYRTVEFLLEDVPFKLP